MRKILCTFHENQSWETQTYVIGHVLYRKIDTVVKKNFLVHITPKVLQSGHWIQSRTKYLATFQFLILSYKHESTTYRFWPGHFYIKPFTHFVFFYFTFIHLLSPLPFLLFPMGVAAPHTAPPPPPITMLGYSVGHTVHVANMRAANRCVFHSHIQHCKWGEGG